MGWYIPYITAGVIPFIDSYRMQLEDIRAQSIFKNLRFKVLLGGILYTYDIMIYINNGYYMQFK